LCHDDTTARGCTRLANLPVLCGVHAWQRFSRP
jgi:hypothetical protein